MSANRTAQHSSSCHVPSTLAQVTILPEIEQNQRVARVWLGVARQADRLSVSGGAASQHSLAHAAAALNGTVFTSLLLILPLISSLRGECCLLLLRRLVRFFIVFLILALWVNARRRLLALPRISKQAGTVCSILPLLLEPLPVNLSACLNSRPFCYERLGFSNLCF